MLARLRVDQGEDITYHHVVPSVEALVAFDVHGGVELAPHTSGNADVVPLPIK